MTNGKFDAAANWDSVTNDYASQARQIDAEWRQRRASILNDRELSNEGRNNRLADIDARRVSAVAKLQETAAAFVESHKRSHARRLEAAATAELDARRKLLGDSVIVDLWARRLAHMDGRAMRAAHAAAVGWEKSIVAAYALAQLDSRRNEFGDFTDVADLEAWQELQPPVDAELAALQDMGRELAAAPEWVESLDLDGNRRAMANKFGLRYEAMVQAADEGQG